MSWNGVVARNDGRETSAVSWCSAVVREEGATGFGGGLGSLMIGIAGCAGGGGSMTGRGDSYGFGRGSGLSDRGFIVYACIDTLYSPESTDVVDGERRLRLLCMPLMRGASELSLNDRI